MLSHLDIGQMALADAGFISANKCDPGNDLMQAARMRSCFVQWDPHTHYAILKPSLAKRAGLSDSDEETGI